MKKKSKSVSLVAGMVVVILLVLLDQVTKSLAVTHLKDQAPFQILPGIFELQYLENHGAAFGILQGQKLFLLAGTGIILLFVLWTYYKMPLEKKFHIMRVIILLIVSGAVGNMIDRISNNYVIDFFYFSLIDFPIFNVADIYVVAAAIGLILSFLLYYKDEDMDAMLPWRN